ncbi:hypothetical protein ACFLUU_04990 [Chloroflexota bacterium]
MSQGTAHQPFKRLEYAIRVIKKPGIYCGPQPQNFRIRFDGSGLSTDGFIDEVLIITNQRFWCDE